MSEHATRVLIIDDHPLFRQGVSQLLALEPSFEEVGQATGGKEGVELVRSLQPDLVLLDLNMRDQGGIQVLQSLRAGGLATTVVVLTVSDAEEDVVQALRAGADGYLLKDMEPELLLAKLRAAAAGQVVVAEALTGLLARALRASTPEPPPETGSLTERENEILALIADGMSNKMIARELGISDGTVKVHVKNLLRKLNLRSRLEAALWALDRGNRG